MTANYFPQKIEIIVKANDRQIGAGRIADIVGSFLDISGYDNVKVNRRDTNSVNYPPAKDTQHKNRHIPINISFHIFDRTDGKTRDGNGMVVTALPEPTDLEELPPGLDAITANMQMHIDAVQALESIESTNNSNLPIVEKVLGLMASYALAYEQHNGPAATRASQLVKSIVEELIDGSDRFPATQEPKYGIGHGRIYNRATGEFIPDDEPVMIYRARDNKALTNLKGYLSNFEAGTPHYNAVLGRVNDFEKFAKDHPERMKYPDTAVPVSAKYNILYRGIPANLPDDQYNANREIPVNWTDDQYNANREIPVNWTDDLTNLKESPVDKPVQDTAYDRTEFINGLIEQLDASDSKKVTPHLDIQNNIKNTVMALQNMAAVWHDGPRRDSRLVKGFEYMIRVTQDTYNLKWKWAEDELEIERNRLAGCGVASMQNTRESAKERINSSNPFYSASYSDVCNTVDREMALREYIEDIRNPDLIEYTVTLLDTQENLVTSEMVQTAYDHLSFMTGVPRKPTPTYIDALSYHEYAKDKSNLSLAAAAIPFGRVIEFWLEISADSNMALKAKWRPSELYFQFLNEERDPNKVVKFSNNIHYNDGKIVYAFMTIPG